MIKPRGVWILVKAMEKKEVKLSSGLLISEEWDVAPESVKGEVMAIGEEVKDIAVGDVVVCPQFAPTKAYELPTDKTFIVNSHDVLAVVVPDKAAK